MTPGPHCDIANGCVNNELVVKWGQANLIDYEVENEQPYQIKKNCYVTSATKLSIRAFKQVLCKLLVTLNNAIAVYTLKNRHYIMKILLR